MDETRFDQATRSLATGRRRALLGLLGLGVGTGLAVAGTSSAGAEDVAPERICRMPTMACGRDRQCCSRKCKNGACGCIGRGGDCWQLGLACCSGRCRRGRCR